MMTDWLASMPRRYHRLDRMGWALSAAGVVLMLAAGTALAMRLQAAEGLRDAAEDAILLDLEPPLPSPAVMAMSAPAPDVPMIDAPEAPDLVEEVPDEAPPPPETLPEPDLAVNDMAPPPVQPDLAPDPLAQADIPPPPPPPEPEPEPVKKPEPKPEPKPKPKKEAKAPPPAQKADSKQAAAPSAQAGKAQAAVPKGQVKQARQRWGAAIRAKVERRKAYPRAAQGAAGTVTVALTVSRNGQLLGTSVAKSSGNAALDAAGLAAVSKAGKFAAAPAELTEASYSFTLPIQFKR